MIGGGSAIEMSHPFYIQTCLALDKLVSLVCGVVVGTSGSLCRFCGGGRHATLPGLDAIIMCTAVSTDIAAKSPGSQVYASS